MGGWVGIYLEFAELSGGGGGVVVIVPGVVERDLGLDVHLGTVRPHQLDFFYRGMGGWVGGWERRWVVWSINYLPGAMFSGTDRMQRYPLARETKASPIPR